MRCFAFYSCDCIETNVKMIKSIVRTRTCEKRPTGTQPKFLSRQCKLQESSGGHRITVWSFQQMSNVLKAAGDRKIKEVQMCLEGGYLVVVSNDVVFTQDGLEQIRKFSSDKITFLTHPVTKSFPFHSLYP